MSGKPSEAGIRELRETLDRLAVLNEEAESLQAEITKRQTRLAVLQEEHVALAGRVPKMLQTMDIASDGNAGWERRLVWALRELANQYRYKQS